MSVGIVTGLDTTDARYCSYRYPGDCAIPALQMDGLRGLGDFGFIPFLIAGSAAVGATVATWLNNNNWTVGEYNNWMAQMNFAITQWDALGWEPKGSGGCWGKNPAQRAAWLDFWKRFSAFYKDHGQIHESIQTPFSKAFDAEERPARSFMQELANWGDWLNKACNVDTGGGGVGPDFHKPDAPPAPVPPGATDWGSVVKWGAIGLGAVALMSVVVNVRQAFGAK